MDQGQALTVEKAELMRECRQLGFAQYTPRTNSWKTALVKRNDASQTLFILFSFVGIDFKVYPDDVALRFDEHSRLYTHGGELKRFRYDQFASPASLHDFVRDIVRKFLQSESVPMDDAFDPKERRKPHWCELCLFDLDGTLLRTADLAAFRGRQHVEQPGDIPGYTMSDAYHEELVKTLRARADRHIYAREQLEALRKAYPDLRLGVLTSSPRHYAHTLLAHAYPGFNWDVIVAFEGTRMPKRSGRSVRLAMQRTGVIDPAKVLLVGDGHDDIEAGFTTGCWVALETGGFPAILDNLHYRLMDRVPDAVLRRPDALMLMMKEPWRFLPELDAVCSTGKENVKPRRVKINVDSMLPQLQGKRTPIVALGRYFAGSLKRRAEWHDLSREMLEFKRSGTFPATWVQVLQRALRGIATYYGGPLLITVLPAKPGRPRNMENLLAFIASHTDRIYGCAYADDVFEFSMGTKSHHFERTTKVERYQNLQESLRLKQAERVGQHHVVVIDDIVTTGATLVSAKVLLEDAGASSVTCLALARAITGLPEWIA